MRIRAGVALGASAAVLASGALAQVAVAAPGSAYAFYPVADSVIQPEENAFLHPQGTLESGDPDGTFVYAVSRKPLTGGAWTAGGAPAGMLLGDLSGRECKPRAGVAGVFTCPAKGLGHVPSPSLKALAGAAHGTQLYYGVVYVPAGGSVAAGIAEAQSAGARPEDGTHAAATVTVKTPARVAQNTMEPAAPAVQAGGSVAQAVKLHAVDAAKLRVTFAPAAGQREWDWDERGVEVTEVTGGPSARCAPAAASALPALECDVLKPGEVTVGYTLRAAASMKAWKMSAKAEYLVYTSPISESNPVKAATFRVVSPYPVYDRHRLLGRAADGWLRAMTGTGKAADPFQGHAELVGSEWGQYGLMAKTAPLTGRGTGGVVVARDKAGVLWRYAPQAGLLSPLGSRTKVGKGWEIYDELAGVSDVTGDGRADLLARDKAGVLWLYAGTGKAAAPFAARTRIGAGWKIFDELTGLGDVTADGKADLLARDAKGALWLYAGTGSAAKPFAPRVQTDLDGAGLRSLAGPGDLTDDGRADLVTQDTAGVLWLYEGTGDPSAPFGTQSRIGRWWDQSTIGSFDTLL
ncbi:VCBS repeat-containing protein [Streptomyces bambusae]|uniref:FG-GAP repeat domain-containing protein n=1 Tax=Streptomyces bambusae TaxID=1550616 RepID=UPI001CFCEEDA|nr:VCBS repeat-containing protein [Streptomyces bambusae]MCB5166162.1 VCBS repeat-containing protein [Streptomyces bambusae]